VLAPVSVEVIFASTLMVAVGAAPVRHGSRRILQTTAPATSGGMGLGPWFFLCIFLGAVIGFGGFFVYRQKVSKDLPAEWMSGGGGDDDGKVLQLPHPTAGVVPLQLALFPELTVASASLQAYLTFPCVSFFFPHEGQERQKKQERQLLRSKL